MDLLPTVQTGHLVLRLSDLLKATQTRQTELGLTPSLSDPKAHVLPSHHAAAATVHKSVRFLEGLVSAASPARSLTSATEPWGGSPWLGAGSAHLILPLREALVAAAVQGCHEEQEGCHADDGDDEGHAEPVLRLFRGPLAPQLHVTDSRLARREEGVYGGEQVPGHLSGDSHSFRRWSAQGVVGPRTPPCCPFSHPPVFQMLANYRSLYSERDAVEQSHWDF